jgi:hypothetical protein
MKWAGKQPAPGGPMHHIAGSCSAAGVAQPAGCLLQPSSSSSPCGLALLLLLLLLLARQYVQRQEGSLPPGRATGSINLTLSWPRRK